MAKDRGKDNEKLSLKKICRRAHEFAAPFRIGDGKKFRLKDVDPGDTLKSGFRGQAPRQGGARAGHRGARRAAGHALRAGPLGRAADLSGDGRRGEGRRHQARDVRRESAGLPGLFVQGADQRGPRPRLPLALHDVPCRSAAASASSTAATTRRCWSCACIPEFLAGQKLPPSCVGKDIWEERVPGHPRLRALPGAQRRRWSASSSCTSRKKEQKRRFLERLDNPEKNWKFSANDVKERGYWDDYMEAYEDTIRETATPSTRRGTSCRPTTSGSRAWSSRPRSSTRSRRWISHYPEGRQGEAEGARGGAESA